MVTPTVKRTYTQRVDSSYIPGQLVIRISEDLTEKYIYKIYVCTPTGELQLLHSQLTCIPLPPAINYEYEEIAESTAQR